MFLGSKRREFLEKFNDIFPNYKSFGRIEHLGVSIFISDVFFASSYRDLLTNRIQEIVSLYEPWERFEGIKYHEFYIEDTQKSDIFSFFDRFFKIAARCEKDGKNLLVHCYAGRSRSCSLLLSYLMRKFSYSFDESLEIVKEERKLVYPNKGFVRQLKVLEDRMRIEKCLRMEKEKKLLGKKKNRSVNRSQKKEIRNNDEGSVMIQVGIIPKKVILDVIERKIETEPCLKSFFERYGDLLEDVRYVNGVITNFERDEKLLTVATVDHLFPPRDFRNNSLNISHEDVSVQFKKTKMKGLNYSSDRVRESCRIDCLLKELSLRVKPYKRKWRMMSLTEEEIEEQIKFIIFVVHQSRSENDTEIDPEEIIETLFKLEDSKLKRLVSTFKSIESEDISSQIFSDHLSFTIEGREDDHFVILTSPKNIRFNAKSDKVDFVSMSFRPGVKHEYFASLPQIKIVHEVKKGENEVEKGENEVEKGEIPIIVVGSSGSFSEVFGSLYACRGFSNSSYKNLMDYVILTKVMKRQNCFEAFTKAQNEKNISFEREPEEVLLMMMEKNKEYYETTKTTSLGFNDQEEQVISDFDFKKQIISDFIDSSRREFKELVNEYTSHPCVTGLFLHGFATTTTRKDADGVEAMKVRECVKALVDSLTLLHSKILDETEYLLRNHSSTRPCVVIDKKLMIEEDIRRLWNHIHSLTSIYANTTQLIKDKKEKEVRTRLIEYVKDSMIIDDGKRERKNIIGFLYDHVPLLSLFFSDYFAYQAAKSNNNNNNNYVLDRNNTIEIIRLSLADQNNYGNSRLFCRNGSLVFNNNNNGSEVVCPPGVKEVRGVPLCQGCSGSGVFLKRRKDKNDSVLQLVGLVNIGQVSYYRREFLDYVVCFDSDGFRRFSGFKEGVVEEEEKEG